MNKEKLKGQPILGIDFGEKRIGLAISEPPYIVATALKTVNIIEEITIIVKDRKISLIVIGLPLQMNGIEGKIAKKARVFGEKIQILTNVDVIFRDERLSSSAVNSIMANAGVKPIKRKQNIDNAAAAFILQGFLDQMNF